MHLNKTQTKSGQKNGPLLENKKTKANKSKQKPGKYTDDEKEVVTSPRFDNKLRAASQQSEGSAATRA